MKQLLLALAVIFSLGLTAQNIEGNVFVYSDTAYSKSSNSDRVDLKIHFYNQLADSTSGIVWKVLSYDAPSDWGKTQVCDNKDCYFDASALTDNLPLLTVEGDDTSNFFKVTMAPKSVGTGRLVIELGMERNDTLGKDTLSFTLNSTYTGIEMFEKKGVELYPNPAVNEVNVDFGSITKGNGMIRIYNMIGQEVKTLMVEEGMLDLEINIEDLNEGPYFMKIYDNDDQAVTIKRFTKKA